MKVLTRKDFKSHGPKIGGLVSLFRLVSKYALFLLTNLFLVCAMWGGLMSGLTVGLLSIDELELELKLMTGTDEEK